MLVIFFLIFGSMLSASMLNMQASYLNEIETYQKDMRQHHAQEAFAAAEKWGQQLGMFPPDKESLRDLVDLELKATSNFIFGDEDHNRHSQYIGYERSAEYGSLYESDRAALVLSDRELDDDLLSNLLGEDANYCGGLAYTSGQGWCPTPTGLVDHEIIRSATQSGVTLAVAEQEAVIRSLADRVSNYFNVKEDFPGTGGNTDRPLLNFVRTKSGSVFNPDAHCNTTTQLLWDGIPVTCDDLYASWHIDSTGTIGSRTVVSNIYSVAPSRFDVPVNVYRSGDDLILYVKVPFPRYGAGAWTSSLSEIRGESRPNGSDSHIFTRLNKTR